MPDSDQSRRQSEDEDDAGAPEHAEAAQNEAECSRSEWRCDGEGNQETSGDVLSRHQTTLPPGSPSSRLGCRLADARPTVVENDNADISERADALEDVDMTCEKVNDTAPSDGLPTPEISIDVDEESSHAESDDNGPVDPDTHTGPSSRPRPPLFLPSPSPPTSSKAPAHPNSLPVNISTSRVGDRLPSLSTSPSPADPAEPEEPPRKRARTSSPLPAPLAAKPRPVQMVLGTTGAAWSLQIQRDRGHKNVDVHDPMKTKPGGRTASARNKIRSRLNNFAAPGSQMKSIRMDDGEDDDGDDECEDDRQETEVMEPLEHSAQEIEVDTSPPAEVRQGTVGSTPTSGTASLIIDLTEDPVGGDNDISDSEAVPQDLDEVAGNVPLRPEIIRTTSTDMTLRFDFDRLSATWSCYRSGPCADPVPPYTLSPSRGLHPSANVANANDAESAERELARVIHKEDFASMQILGQFNLGFIITRRLAIEEDGNAKRGADDLFIIDQHAADEKYNFETLQQTTKIESQKLFQPRPLELTAADELVAIENLDVLRSNGFEVVVDEDPCSGQRERVKLVAQPVSKGTMFDMKGRNPGSSYMLQDIVLIKLFVSCRLGGAAAPDARPA